jgi:hypothetical protein
MTDSVVAQSGIRRLPIGIGVDTFACGVSGTAI